MVVVDAHVHTSDLWYEPIETLLFHMDRNKVDQASLVQMRGNNDNSYQFTCVKRYPGRFSNVVNVDTNRDDAVETLTRLAEMGASGVRLRPFTRSPGADPFAIWRACVKLDLSVSCGGRSTADLLDPAFAELLKAVPEVRIVVEHLGAENHPNPKDSDPVARRRVLELASHPNLFMKIHGLGEFSQKQSPLTGPTPFVFPIPPFLQQAYELFGPERLMWGSDFPPVEKREGYGLALKLCREQFADKPKAHQDMIFGGTAARLFPAR
jgi:L-fuconolactonase